nr:hypothetical protein BdHM001_34910 [Bdellovibrio sp. HM001]
MDPLLVVIVILVMSLGTKAERNSDLERQLREAEDRPAMIQVMPEE